MLSRSLWSFFSLVLVILIGMGCQSKEPSAPSYRFVEAWTGAGSESGPFRNPIGIETDGEEVYVSEAEGRRIRVFNRAGEERRQIGPVLAPGDTLRRPMHIAIGDSTLYVPDYTADRVYRLSLEGTVRGTLAPSAAGTGFDAPGGVAVDEAGRVYVTDFYRHRTLRFGPQGPLDRQWGVTDSSGGAPDRFTYPTDVVTLPDGFVVADAYNHRIKRYRADTLAWVRPSDQTWADSTAGTFNVATAVAAGPDGHVFVADFFNHRIQEFTPDGQFVRAFGEKGSGDGQFERPVDLAFDDDGRLYVVDLGNDRVQVFSPTSK